MPPTEAQTNVHVRVKCPHCQATGRINASRFDKTFTCSKCQKQFHVDIDSTKKGAREEQKAEQVVGANYKVEVIRPSRVAIWWEKIPRAAKMGVITSVVAFAVYYFVGDFLLPGAALPESLEERSVLAIQSVISSDLKMLQRLSFKPHYVEAKGWMQKVRPVAWPPKFPAEQPAQFNAKVHNKSRGRDPEKSGIAETAMVIVAVKAPFSPMTPEKEFSLFWNQRQSDLAWLIDMKRTNDSVIAYGQ